MPLNILCFALLSDLSGNTSVPFYKISEKKESFNKRASRINVEETQVDKAVCHIIARMKEHDNLSTKESEEKHLTLEKDRADAEECRRKAMKKLAESKKCKQQTESASASCGGKQAGQKPPKRGSLGRNDTFQFLRERADKDHETKLAKQKKQAEMRKDMKHFQQQMLQQMQQQQQHFQQQLQHQQQQQQQMQQNQLFIALIERFTK